jgi:quinoprotein glucose dehydrogenase
MPGEKAWPTQPIPSAPPTFVRHEVTEETLNPYLTEDAKQHWIKRLDSARSGLFVPHSDKYETITMPGALGGASYGNTASDPRKGIMYVMAEDYPSVYKLSRVVPVKPVMSNDELKKMNALYEGSCQACHGKDMAGSGAGPSLVNVGQRYFYDEFKTLVTEGRGRMPGLVHIDDDALFTLYKYLGGAPFRGNRRGNSDVKVEGPVVASGGAVIPPDVSRAAGLTDYPQDVPHPPDRYTTGYGLDWPGLASPPWASIFAFDLNEGKIIWQKPIGLDSAFAKGDKSMGAPAGTIRKGMIVTSTGLVIATGKGGVMYAFDSENGEVLWETQLSGESTGQPGMYQVNGKQYLVVNASNRFESGSYDLTKREGARPRGYIVYSLPSHD